MWDIILNKKLYSQTAGNTLVEVFVALVIIGVAIAGAYATANRSITLTQASQERAEAIKIAEGQIEAIKASVAADSEDDFFDDSRAFCVTDDGPGSFDPGEFNQNFVLPAYEDVDELRADDSDEQAYPTDCVLRGRYFTHIDYNENGSRFTVTVRWERFGGASVEQTELVYGIYQ